MSKETINETKIQKISFQNETFKSSLDSLKQIHQFQVNEDG
jgi:hypothetical protein